MSKKHDFECNTQERIRLAQIFYTTSLSDDYPTWLNTGDHCEWGGITCNNDTKKVTDITFDGLAISGPYPSNLAHLSELSTLITLRNSLTGLVSTNDICSNTDIAADETNCPNDVDEVGCCDVVRITNPSPYIDAIVADELGSSDCDSLSGIDVDVCNYMRNKDNHYVFDDDQYPAGFPYDDWLRVRTKKYMK